MKVLNKMILYDKNQKNPKILIKIKFYLESKKFIIIR